MTPSHMQLSRRERQIMDVLYERGSASVAQVRARLPDPPSYSAVRALLRVLEDKGQLKHRQDGPRYVYQPVLPRATARRTAVERLVRTFFEGSTEQAMAALLDGTRLDEEELRRLAELIQSARKEGR